MRRHASLPAWACAAIQAFLALGALPAAGSMLRDPSGNGLGLRVEWLAGSPLPDYRLPGLVLLLVIGLGGLALSVLSAGRHRWAPALSIAMGLFLVAWIGFQWAWLQPQHWLQPVVLVLGLAQAGLGAWLRQPASQGWTELQDDQIIFS